MVSSALPLRAFYGHFASPYAPVQTGITRNQSCIHRRWQPALLRERSGNVKTLDEGVKKMCLVHIGKNLPAEKKAEFLATLIAMKLKGEI